MNRKRGIAITLDYAAMDEPGACQPSSWSDKSISKFNEVTQTMTTSSEQLTGLVFMVVLISL